MTDQELLKKWTEKSRECKELWREICGRNLALKAMGIDPEKRDSSWRNPVLVLVPVKKPGKKMKEIPDFDLLPD